MTLQHRFHSARAARLAFCGAYAAVSLIAFNIYVRIVPSPDQSLFDYLAWLQLDGVPLYKGSFDMTWPGELVFHELYIIIFGVHYWTARAGDFLLLQPAILAIFQFLKRAGFRRAAVAAALVYPIIYVTSGGWMAGHRDFIAAHFLVAAAIFALPSDQRGRWAPYLAGAFIGYATTIRPTFLAFGPLLFLIALSDWKGSFSWVGAFVRKAVPFSLGILTPAAAFLVCGLITGTLGSWYTDSILFVVSVYPAPLPVVRLFSAAAGILIHMFWWLTIAGLLGAILWHASGRSRRGLWLVLALVATMFLSYFAQNKGFGYHLAGLIPAFVILAAAGADAGIHLPVSSAMFRNTLAGVTACLLVAGTGLRLFHAIPRPPDWGREEQARGLKLNDSLALAKIIRSESGPADTFLQWGWEYQVNFLSERRSPSRFVNTQGARLISPNQPVFGKWLTEFAQDLSERPPKFILVDESLIPRGTGLPASAPPTGEAMLEIVRRRLDTGYFIRDRRGNDILLERLDPETKKLRIVRQ